MTPSFGDGLVVILGLCDTVGDGVEAGETNNLLASSSSPGGVSVAIEAIGMRLEPC